MLDRLFALSPWSTQDTEYDQSVPASTADSRNNSSVGSAKLSAAIGDALRGFGYSDDDDSPADESGQVTAEETEDESVPASTADSRNNSSAGSSRQSTAIDNAFQGLVISSEDSSPDDELTDEEMALIWASSVPVDPNPPPSTFLAPPSHPPPIPAPQATGISVPQQLRAHSSHSSEIPPGFYIIAHNKETQRLFDSMNISWSVQFMLALEVLLGETWEAVRSNLHKFTGDELQAAQVHAIMKAKPPSSSPDLTIWYEYLREQAAIFENVGRGCGLMGLWQGVADWHGGNIQQLIAVSRNGNEFTFRIQQPEQRRTHRLARCYGSRRILIFRIGNMKIDQVAIDFFCQKFVLLGRVFRAFHAKEKSIYLFETNEDFDRVPNLAIGDQYRPSPTEFRETFNPIQNNSKQPISKWSTRWAILLSNAIPALEFAEENIFYIDDIHAEGTDRSKKVPAHQVMTDGAGLINLAALIAIKHKFSHDAVSAAVQGRIGGSKGLWILNPADKSQEPRIWIRDSQVKIKLLSYSHRVHRIFDFLAASRPSTWCFLSTQSLMNLSYNGVPDQALAKLMRDAIDLEVAPLMDWERLNAMVFLCDVVGKVGGVSGMRMQRQARGESRALGYRDRDFNDDVDDADVREITDNSILSTGRNPHSGAPISAHEAAYELLQAGFEPRSCKVLWTKLKSIVKVSLDSTIGKYKIPVDGVHGYVIPDPVGVLEEGQVYYHSSKPMINPVTQEQRFNITGDVLVGRYPIRLPSDIQKVTAVACTQLHQWMDVIIVSTKGVRSQASWLSGGDYDGDDLFLICEPAIVENFTNSPLTEEPPKFMEENFDRSVEGVEDFVRRASSLPANVGASLWQSQFILGLGATSVGIYSKYQEVSIYSNGYDHPESVRLGYMFNTLLDASKTGLRLKSGIKKEDSRKYNRSLPEWMPSSTPGDDYDSRSFSQSQPTAVRKEGADEFILEVLYKEGMDVKEAQMRKFEDKTSGDWEEKHDPILLAPYLQARTMAASIAQFRVELGLIEEHVKAAHRLWNTAIQSGRSLKRKNGTNSDPYFVVTQAFSKPIPDLKFTPNVEEVKASYAYYFGKPSFAFSVGFRELCLIKARASRGGIAPAARIFDEMKGFLSSGMRALGRNESTV